MKNRRVTQLCCGATMLGAGLLWGCDARVLGAETDGGTDDIEEQTTDTQTDDSSDTDAERPSAFASVNTTRTESYTGFYSPLAQGTVYVSSRNISEYGTQTSVEAQFYNVIGSGDWTEEISYIVEPGGIDTCSLGLLPVVSFGSDEDEVFQWMDAGELSLHSSEETYAMEEAFIDEEAGSVRYYKYDWPEGFTDFYDEELSMTATGGDTPVFPGDTVWGIMPPEYSILNPPNDSSVSLGPLELSWTSDVSTTTVDISFFVFLKVNESETGYEMQDVHRLRCTVVDDGNFSVPKEIMNQLPSGYSMRGGVYRTDSVLRTVTSDFSVQFVTVVSSEISLNIP